MVEPESRANEEQCYLCGKPSGELTRDHVPPACLFPKPRPSNLITLPCCEDCQREYQKDEEYFRTNISTISDIETNEKVKEIWQTTLRSLSRSHGLRKDVISRMAPAEIKSPSGLYFGSATGISIPQDRTKRVLRKIALGLYYHHTGSRITDDFEVDVYFQPKEYSPDLLKQFRYIGYFKDVFSYGGVFTTDSESSVWSMSFYRSVAAVVIFISPAKDDAGSSIPQNAQ